MQVSQSIWLRLEVYNKGLGMLYNLKLRGHEIFTFLQAQKDHIHLHESLCSAFTALIQSTWSRLQCIKVDY